MIHNWYRFQPFSYPEWPTPCSFRGAWVLQAVLWYPNPDGMSISPQKHWRLLLQISSLQSCHSSCNHLLFVFFIIPVLLIPFPCWDDPPGKPLSTKNIFGTIYGCRFFHGSAPLFDFSKEWFLLERVKQILIYAVCSHFQRNMPQIVALATDLEHHKSEFVKVIS